MTGWWLLMNNNEQLHPFTDYPDCVTGPDKRKIIVLEEKGKEYRALNNNEKNCVALQIDKGIIKNDSSKCDKGLIVIDDKKFYLVELKGVDVSTACKQLFSTYDKFSKELKSWNYEYFCRAVVANMPSPNNYPTSYRILMKALKNNKNKLVCKSKKLEEHI